MGVAQNLLDRYAVGGENGEFVGIKPELPLDLAGIAGVAGAVAVVNEVTFDFDLVQQVSVPVFLVAGVVSGLTAVVAHIKNSFGLTITAREMHIGQREGENGSE